MLLDDVPSAVERFATAVAGQAETVHERLFVGEDELLVHPRRDVERLLALGEPPHVARADVPRKIRLRQFVGVAESSRADVGPVVVQAQQMVGLQVIELFQITPRQDPQQLLQLVRMLDEVA